MHFARQFFRPIYRKRSSKTPANEHPVAEEDAAEKEFEATDSLIPNANKNLQEPELLIDLEICSSLEGNRKIVFSVLSENPIHFEAICKATKLSAGIVGAELIMLELEDLVKSFPGDMYSLADRIKKTDSTQSPGPNPDQNLTFAGEVRVDRASMDALIFDFLQNAEAGDSLEGTAGDSNESFAKKASRFMIFVKEIYRGISRKYLQLYLARYWCLMDRTTWNSESSSLLKACARFRGHIAGRIESICLRANGSSSILRAHKCSARFGLLISLICLAKWIVAASWRILLSIFGRNCIFPALRRGWPGARRFWFWGPIFESSRCSGFQLERLTFQR